MGAGGLGCGAKLAKMFLFIFNIIFFLLGAACLGVGIWIMVDKPKLIELTSMVSDLDNEGLVGLLEGGVIALLVAGAIVFVIGFVGCFGACKEIKCLLYIYAIIVLLILLAEIAGGVLGYIYKDDVENKLQTFLNDTISQKYDGGINFQTGKIETTELYSLAWEFVMWKFGCCGIYNGSDFNSATQWNSTLVYSGMTYNLQYPISCCKVSTGSLPSSLDDFVNATACINNPADTVYSNVHLGCYDTIKSQILEYSYVVIGIGIGIAVIEVVGIIAACCLIKAINKEKEKNEHV